MDNLRSAVAQLSSLAAEKKKEKKATKAVRAGAAKQGEEGVQPAVRMEMDDGGVAVGLEQGGVGTNTFSESLRSGGNDDGQGEGSSRGQGRGQGKGQKRSAVADEEGGTASELLPPRRGRRERQASEKGRNMDRGI